MNAGDTLVGRSARTREGCWTKVQWKFSRLHCAKTPMHIVENLQITGDVSWSERRRKKCRTKKIEPTRKTSRDLHSYHVNAGNPLYDNPVVRRPCGVRAAVKSIWGAHRVSFRFPSYTGNWHCHMTPDSTQAVLLVLFIYMFIHMCVFIQTRDSIW